MKRKGNLLYHGVVGLLMLSLGVCCYCCWVPVVVNNDVVVDVVDLLLLGSSCYWDVVVVG